jgi:sugar lactone lactonase YvrE
VIQIFTIEGNSVPGFESFLAYPTKYKGGVHVTVADVNGDGKPDIITVPSYGVADVRVFFNRYDASNPASPAFSATPDISFKAFSKAITGGSVVSAGDMGYWTGTRFENTPDGKAEIVVGTGAGVKATVTVFDVSTGTARPVRSFFPFTQVNTNFKGGVSLEVAKVNADPVPDIIVGMGVNGTSRIEVYTWNSGSLDPPVAIPNAFLGPSYRAPVDVAAIMDSNGFAETIVAVQGPGASTQQIRRFDIVSRSPLVFQQDTPLTSFPGPWFIATSRNFTSTSAGPVNLRAAVPFDEDASPKFFVVDDRANNVFHYGELGNHQGDRDFAPGQIQQRGITTTADGSRVWTVDAKKVVRAFDADGTLLGSWTAPKLKSPSGIATDGVNIWIVDQKAKAVYRFDNAAEVTSGSLNASSSFKLHKSNTKAEGITTDGQRLWVADNGSKQDRVYVYSATGGSLGSWIIDPVNAMPTGLTIDPTGASESIWIVDGQQAAVYEYADVRTAVSGSNFATDVFALAAGNTAPRGIADPDRGLAPSRKAEKVGKEAADAGSGSTAAAVNAVFAQVASAAGPAPFSPWSDVRPARLASPTTSKNDPIRADLPASAGVDSLLAARPQKMFRADDPATDLLADLALRRNASPQQDRLFSDLRWLDSFALL